MVEKSGKVSRGRLDQANAFSETATSWGLIVAIGFVALAMVEGLFA